jgi:UDP-N-acetylglucosamine--N-acetylmuramyl-(pentapeptide) pyrophosphoryl-undecaprenol N-acetylglucosamine transferase
MRIILLAGGSGGHITPALAVAHEIRHIESDADCIFLCSRNELDKKILFQSGERFIPIFSGKIRRYFSWQNFIDPIFLFFGFFQSLFFFLFHRPDCIFSKGGFAAFPPALAAYILRIPIIVHESDSVPGLANRIIQRFAKKVLTSFPSDFGECVGVPLRSSLLLADSQKGKAFLSFSRNEKPIVFGFGGSQGSDFLNKKIIQNIDALLPKANIVWISGAKHSSLFPEREGLRVFEYLHEEFFHVLAASDLVIMRSGSSIFEAAALQIPMLLIPLSSSANNHQEKNAEVFSQKNSAEVLLEKDCDLKRFANVIVELLEDVGKRNRLAKNAYRLVRFEAAKRIAENLIGILHEKKEGKQDHQKSLSE